VICVVGAVLVDDLERPSRLLAARRSTPPALSGRWEFPGGKVEPGEEQVAALRRELAEELRVDVRVGAEILSPAGGPWPVSATYEMRLWWATIASGRPRPTGSHSEVRWLGRYDLLDVDWLPADVAVVRHLAPQLARPGCHPWFRRWAAG